MGDEHLDEFAQRDKEDDTKTRTWGSLIWDVWNERR